MLLTAVPQVLTVCIGHQNNVKLNISIRKCKTKTSDEHKLCTAQAFDIALGGQTLDRGRLLPPRTTPAVAQQGRRQFGANGVGLVAFSDIQRRF